MSDAAYAILVMIACALWAFIACATLDRAYGRIDVVQQETTHVYYF